MYVAVKSSIIQPSAVVHAHTELSKLLIREKKDEQYIGILLTGGGPEHNLNFTLVQIALIIMWRMVTFDILVVCRSCPQNSWTNEVERVISVLNLGLYSMCFSILKMVPDPDSNVGSDRDSLMASSELLEQKWRCSGNMSQLRQRLEENVDFLKAADISVGGACEEMTKRFLNLTWTDREIERGYIADNEEMKDFVQVLNYLDPAIGEFTQQTYLKSDVFSSAKMKEMFSKKNSMNDFIETHCFKSAYLFQVMAICWVKTANEEIEAGRNPDNFEGLVHSTCPFNCRRPTQPLSGFVLSSFMPCPDKDPLDKGINSPYISYQTAKERIKKGNKNSGDTFVPSLSSVEAKSKWAVPPVNTKGEYLSFLIFHFSFSLVIFHFPLFNPSGAEIKPHTLCHVKNIYSTLRCKSCGKPRGVFLVAGKKISSNDKIKVDAFLENQSLNFTCGTDFSEIVSSIDFDKAVSRPYCATFSGNLVLSCLHPVDEKVRKRTFF